MKKLFIIIFLMFSLIIFAPDTYAAVDSDGRANNQVGIHILFPEELEKASQLVNTMGGEWGYVTIPIQIGDLDRARWQKFMDDSARLRLIPIVRLATEPYYKNTAVWRKPTGADILDFANFLDGLSWPTKNRYVILFNEVNRFDEWGGEAPSPAAYAEIVDYAIQVFDRKNKEFFVITAGLDNASPNDRVKYMDNMVYLREMEQAVPGVFAKIDGISSHSYPNPGFSEPPSTNKIEGTATYRFENELISGFTGSKKPVFLTETGWDAENIGIDLASRYLAASFNEIWLKDEDIIAVTPFLLDAAAGPFAKFGFFENGKLNKNGEVLAGVTKIKGQPELNENKKLEEVAPNVSPVQEFAYSQIPGINNENASGVLKHYFKTLFGVY